ncbi:MAG: hypothetical protein V3S29_10305 [bacterium]
MKKPATGPGDQNAPAGEDRFDSLLDERFGAAGRREMASRIADHDRGGVAAFDREHVRRKIRFHGEIPDKVKASLREWLPELVAFAAENGLRLRDLNHELHFFQQAAFESQFGAVPAGVTLPASSYQFNQLYRVYSVRVVLPPQIATISQLLAVLRAALSRLFGDIFLREEIFSLEAYREDLSGGDEELTFGLEEKIQLLAGDPICPPPLEHVLVVHARAINLNYKRMPDQVRKDFFKVAMRQLEEQKLPEMSEAAIESTFSAYLAGLRAGLAGALEQTVQEVEALNGQLNFLPPDDLPEYIRLRKNNGMHYLRSAKFRLNFLLEALGGFLEGYAELERSDGAASPLVEEQMEGYLAELRAQKLARPYLIPDVNLSDELARQKANFPFEVNALLAALPPPAEPAKAFKALSNRIKNSLYQRCYHAFLLAGAWGKARGQGRGEGFRASERFATLKGLAANFRFRRPMLEALFIKIGIVLEFAEKEGAAGEESPGKQRFPVEAFARAWGQLIPHALLAEYLRGKGGVRGFDYGRYWAGVDEGLRRGIAGRAGPPHLSLALRELHRQGGAEGLAILPEIVRYPTGTLRFMVARALAPPAGDKAGPAGKRAESRLEELQKWAALVLRTREATRRNAIVVSGPG